MFWQFLGHGLLARSADGLHLLDVARSGDRPQRDHDRALAGRTRVAYFSDTHYDPPVITATMAAVTTRFGPSGAGVWGGANGGSEAAAGATGNNDPAPAPDLDTGAVRWTGQMNPGDASSLGSIVPGESNCPQAPGGDTDPGASPMLICAAGADVLVIGQESGIVYGLDPERRGEVALEDAHRARGNIRAA